MIFAIPLTVFFGILTIISLFATISSGVAMHRFRKLVFKYHRFFAFLTGILVLIHATLAFLLWFFGIVI